MQLRPPTPESRASHPPSMCHFLREEGFFANGWRRAMSHQQSQPQHPSIRHMATLRLYASAALLRLRRRFSDVGASVAVGALSLASEDRRLGARLLEAANGDTGTSWSEAEAVSTADLAAALDLQEPAAAGLFILLIACGVAASCGSLARGASRSSLSMAPTPPMRSESCHKCPSVSSAIVSAASSTAPLSAALSASHSTATSSSDVASLLRLLRLAAVASLRLRPAPCYPGSSARACSTFGCSVSSRTRGLPLALALPVPVRRPPHIFPLPLALTLAVPSSPLPDPLLLSEPDFPLLSPSTDAISVVNYSGHVRLSFARSMVRISSRLLLRSEFV